MSEEIKKEMLEKLIKAPYDCVANNYWRMDKEFLKEIALNAIYQLSKQQEEEMIQDIIERNF